MTQRMKWNMNHNYMIENATEMAIQYISTKNKYCTSIYWKLLKTWNNKHNRYEIHGEHSLLDLVFFISGFLEAFQQFLADATQPAISPRHKQWKKQQIISK